jgi:hypothetical protein
MRGGLALDQRERDTEDNRCRGDISSVTHALAGLLRVR